MFLIFQPPKNCKERTDKPVSLGPKKITKVRCRREKPETKFQHFLNIF